MDKGSPDAFSMNLDVTRKHLIGLFRQMLGTARELSQKEKGTARRNLGSLPGLPFLSLIQDEGST